MAGIRIAMGVGFSMGNEMIPTIQSDLIIAEIAQAHEGSLGVAHAMIDAASDARADAVKFQTHIASAESTYDEPWRVKFSQQDETRFDYWKRMEISEMQWMKLAEHARKRNLIFLSSPFSVEAVEMLDRIGVPMWKIASGELRNRELLDAIWETEKPLLISSGMSGLHELDSVVEETKKRCIPYAIFQCNSEYPSLPESWGLNMIDELRNRYRCPVGLSDHSGTIYAGLAAATLGASLIEVHVTFSKKMFGPDVPASITFEELAILSDGVRQIKRAINSPIDKDAQAARKEAMRSIFGRSWALKKDLPAGTVLKREHLALKKPGSGITLDRLQDVLGRTLICDKSSLRLLSWDDLK